MKKNHTDQQILRLLNDEPSEGMSLLMEQYMGLLWSACRLSLDNPEDIRECVQETLADFYEHKDRFCLEKGTLKAYLYVIARRKAIQTAGQNGRYPAEPLKKEMADKRDEMEQILDRTMLEEALSGLREQDSRMIRMRYYDGMTCSQIARSMNLPLETVKKRQQRSLKKLQRILTALAVLSILTACAAAVVHRIRFSPSTGFQGMEEDVWYELSEAPAVLDTAHGTVTMERLIWKEHELYLQMELDDCTLDSSQLEEAVCLLDPDADHPRMSREMSIRQGKESPFQLEQIYFVPEPRTEYTFRIFEEEYTFLMQPIEAYEDFSKVGESLTYGGRTIVIRSRQKDGRLLADAYTCSENSWKIIRLGTELHTGWSAERLQGETAFHYETEADPDQPYFLNIDSTVLQFTGEVPVIKIPVPKDSADVDISFQAGEDTYRITRISRSRGTFQWFLAEEDGTETLQYGDEILIEVRPEELEADTRLIGVLGNLGQIRLQKRYRTDEETGQMKEIGSTEAFQMYWSGDFQIPEQTVRIRAADPEELPEEAYLQITGIYKYWDQPYQFELKP